MMQRTKKSHTENLEQIIIHFILKTKVKTIQFNTLFNEYMYQLKLKTQTLPQQ